VSIKIAFVRTMPHFSMDAYADGLITGLKTVYPGLETIELVPSFFDRSAKSPVIRAQKAYERFWRFPRTVQIQQQNVDLFHIIDHSDAHIVRWLRSTGKPVVVTCHDLINLLYPENLKGSVRLPVVSDNLGLYSIKGMEYADAIVAVSSETAKNISQLLDIKKDRLFIVPNTLDPTFKTLSEEEYQSFHPKLKISSGTFYLLNVGGNHPRKNLSSILKALKILKQKGLPVQFWKVSDDFVDEDRRFIRSNCLEDSIKYLGYLDKPTLAKVYNAANVLIAPSFHEGFGITLLEAMACGTPVITSNVSAMPEVVNDSGILVDPKSPQAIADAVYSLYKFPSRYNELREKGINRSSLFTRENVAQQMAHIYESLLNEKMH
jgi:glycosyltransferase involved in cell wall biosynthesis